MSEDQIKELRAPAQSGLSPTQPTEGGSNPQPSPSLEELPTVLTLCLHGPTAVVEFFKAVMERLKIAEEKNEEYAKLVAAQAREYAEKLDGKIVVDRKQLVDLMKRQPFPEAFKWITDFKSQYQHWTKKLKELLATSRELKP